jgi:hypothetical protein
MKLYMRPAKDGQACMGLPAHVKQSLVELGLARCRRCATMGNRH